MKKECKNCLRHYNNSCLQCQDLNYEYFEDVSNDSELYSALMGNLHYSSIRIHKDISKTVEKYDINESESIPNKSLKLKPI